MFCRKHVPNSMADRSSLINSCQSYKKSRILPLAMGQAASYIRYLISWSSGLAAACLFLLSPSQAAEISSATARQAYVSCSASQRPDRKPDVASIVGCHGSMALVNARAGFSFGPSLVSLPYLLAAFAQKSGPQAPAQQHGSYYSFRFLQLIFEHQIAINAP